MTQMDKVKSRVFLPPEDPVVIYKKECLKEFNQLMIHLPEFIVSGKLAWEIDHHLGYMPHWFGGVKNVLTDNEKVALRRDLAFLQSALRNSEECFDKSCISKILTELSEEEGTAPELSYHLYVLNNFQRKDSLFSRELGNLKSVRRFTSLVDEEWFILTHLACALYGEQLLEHIIKCLDIMDSGNSVNVVGIYLRNINLILEQIQRRLDRLHEACSPAVFRDKVFPYMSRFEPEENPLLHILDAFYGVSHGEAGVNECIKNARKYMTLNQVRCVELIEAVSPIRNFIQKSDNQVLQRLFNRGMMSLVSIRGIHWRFANELEDNQASSPLVGSSLASLIFPFGLQGYSAS